MPLHHVRDAAETAYFHETRRNDMKMREVADLMQVSMSKVALLSKSLKQNFVRPDIEEELERRIEFMLWAEPLSVAKMRQVLTDVKPKDVKRAVQKLKQEGRIEKVELENTWVYQLNIETDRRSWETWIARIDGLQNALRNVGDAVYARFVSGDPSAFARTLQFRAKKDQLGRLSEAYEELFALVVELDQEAQEAREDEVEELGLSVFWAPNNHVEREIEAGNED
jgi:Asp-tRNA(Asn)/Glu-tRNA(Gln) amidotransferase A subunit family amidase